MKIVYKNKLSQFIVGEVLFWKKPSTIKKKFLFDRTFDKII
jgi:hypothetical protein